MVVGVPIPQEYLCPITGEMMKEPVCDREGNTYEKEAILKWIASSGTSPITRNRLVAGDLAPNRALRDAIETWATANGWEVPADQKRVPLQPPSGGAAQTKAAALLQNCSVSLKFVHEPRSGKCLLSVIPPAAPADGARAAMDIVCVIDISGSMGTEATVKDEKGKSESHGLSILDVVKHAAKTVANMLGENDRFALVTFSSTASTPLKLTSMNEAGKQQVASTLSGISEGGQTNLWDGLHTAMELLKGETSGRNASILLLTDGCPNVEPPRGHIPSLRQYYDKLGGTPNFTVSTFGFGYSLDSKLLNDIATESNGMYVFIPDSGLVGTVFVNTVGNLLATVGTTVTVSIECDGAKVGPQLASPVDDSTTALLVPTSYGGQCQLGSIQFGQSRDIYFAVAPTPNSVAPGLFAKVEYVCGGKKSVATAEAIQITPESDTQLVVQAARADFLRTARSLFQSKAAPSKEAVAVVKAFSGRWVGMKSADKLIDGLVYDMEGQVQEALTVNGAWDKWGKHFLPSLVRANVLQQCNNFKDHSVQCYGGALFVQLQSEGEAIFTKIPPPEPRRSTSYMSGSASSGARTPSPVQMTSYYNYSGGCVAAQSRILMATGGMKPAREVGKGDVLANGAMVLCQVKIRVPTGGMELVQLQDGLLISPYHPILENGQWVFPIQSNCARSTTYHHADEFLYNYVLDGHHTIVADGVELVSLGHGLSCNSVVKHNYFGTDRIVNDLKGLPGFGEGLVVVSTFLRDAVSNMVCGLRGD